MFIKNHFRVAFFLLALMYMTCCAAYHQKDIYIYNDKGVCEDSFEHIKYTLAECLTEEYSVQLISASEIEAGKWMDDAALIIIPGGADVPYTQQLNGKGNELIKEYVKNGGNYLGFCAGAYYGSGFVEFDKGGPLEVLGDRELAFFPGKCIGPIFTYDYSSNRGARAVRIDSHHAENGSFATYYNGGGVFFNLGQYKNVEVVGNYSDLNQPAIIMVKYGKGKVILSAVHFEYSYLWLDKDDIYLENIINVLKENETSRLNFFSKMLTMFELNGFTKD